MLREPFLELPDAAESFQVDIGADVGRHGRVRKKVLGSGGFQVDQYHHHPMLVVQDGSHVGRNEGCCRTLTEQLKGAGMRWDARHAEAVMALDVLNSSGPYDAYWPTQARSVAERRQNSWAGQKCLPSAWRRGLRV